MKTNKEKRINELVELLNNYRFNYYNNNKDIISDLEYDKLENELRILEEETGIILENSPTHTVLHEVSSKLVKVEHKKPTLSLQKTKSTEELKTFIGNVESIISYKLDGLTVVLTYEDGKLILGATRGTGIVGEDITHNVKVFKNVPKKIDYKGKLVIRGEAIIKLSDFEKINKAMEIKGEELYKNPRNLCSGSVRQLDSKIASNRHINFISFGILECDKSFIKKSETLEFLKEQGFETVEYFKITKNDVDEVIKNYTVKIPKEDFATDGLVITFNDISYSTSLGSTSKFPHDSIAFKWKDELVKTKLVNVFWNTSRAGTINPVAIFEPVEIESTIVEKASLHNLSIFKSFELGVGDEISVYKANMIIPQLGENFTKSNTLNYPEKCPSCDAKTEVIQGVKGESLHCTNENCPSKLLYKMSHFVSRDAMNIEGFSEATLELFLNLEFMKSYADIYRLENLKDEITNLKGFGEKSFKNLTDSINSSKKVNLVNLLYSLGINNFGLQSSKLLIEKLNIKEFTQLYSITFDDLVGIKGIGDTMAKSFLDYFKKTVNRDIVTDLVQYLDIYTEDKSTSNVLEDKSFVITGKLETFSNRKELQNKIEDLGGKVIGSVSTKTDYLINNDNLSTSSKNKKAKELNIPIITEEDFRKLIGE